MMAGTASDVIERIQAHCKQTRVRVHEFFADFDKLRSGFVSPQQFRRSLDMCGLGPLLTDQDARSLADAFASPDGLRVNYAAFCDTVDSVFTVKKLEKTPTLQPSSSNSGGGGSSPLQRSRKAAAQNAATLTPEQWQVFGQKQAEYIKETQARGLILKEFFRDFDPHRCGRVTVPQFKRCFPFRVDQPTLDAFVQRYRDGDGDVNYLAWVTDVNDAIAAEQTTSPRQREARVRTPKPTMDSDALLLELQKQVLVNRIRVAEVFRDYDRLRSGFVSDAQFASGLGMLKFQKFALLPEHIGMLVSRYVVGEELGVKRVAYTRFVDEMDGVFTEKGLEKTPLKRAGLRTDLLQKSVTVLPLANEQRVNELLEQIRSTIRTRRILLRPFFQDFDRVTKGVYQTKHTTRSRFERALAYVGITLSAADFRILCDKYQVVESSGAPSENVAYDDFCRDVDPMYSEKPYEPSASASASSSPPSPLSGSAKFVKPGKTGRVDIFEIEEDIQTHCLTKRVRIHEYFRDFDPLRSGLVTEAQFGSALAISGITLDPEELNLLCTKYASPARPGSVRWLEFADHIDEVFTTKRLEQHPTQSSSVTTQKILQKKAVELEPYITDETSTALQKIRDCVRARGILLPPFFRDFDRHNSGRITSSQFQQVLSRHQFSLTDGEVRALLASYTELRTRDVNYRRFIQDTEPEQMGGGGFSPTYNSHSYSTNNSNSNSNSRSAHRATFEEEEHAAAGGAAVDVGGLIEVLQSRVHKDRVRVREFFLDADRLRKGYVSNAKFRSGLDMAGFHLREEELAALEAQFNYPAAPESFNYVDFCNTLDSVFVTYGLEKSPTKAVTPYKPRARHPLKADTKPLDMPDALGAADVLRKVKTIIDTRRVNPKPYFQDFDKIRKERVTPTQFASVLDKLRLVLTPGEVQLLVKRFEDARGDVDYTRFCLEVDPVPLFS
eukprot:TRINITY_DN979_c0_g1_i1.p1 TRINITY_DN979_c0_g1~~TRINITY_DN979_c0_g1_i1.p1  ORF type:complete len:950 (-),score=242.08 TRINITY_DN979_c0_g1_i1:372-3221(-)